MDTLPVELVTAILEWLIYSSGRPSSNCQYEDVLGVSHVSQRLRDVALSSPSLWTAVDFSQNSPAYLSQACLHRSKACGINVSVDTRSIAEGDVQRIVTDLANHVARWSSFKLDAETATEQVAQAIFHTLGEAFHRHPASVLTSLDIAGSLKPASATSWRTLADLVAPRLQRLALSRAGMDWEVASFPLLRDLKLAALGGSQSPSVADFMSFLRASPRLGSIQLLQVAIHDSDDLDATGFSLPSLTTLTMENTSLGFVHHFLSLVDVPHLTQLRIGAHTAPQNLDWSSLPLHVLSNVRDLTWNVTTGPPSEAHALRISSLISNLLRRVPNAAHVTISSTNALNQLVSTSQEPPSEEAVLPKMTQLDCIGMKGCGLDVLESLVEARRSNGSAKLARLSLSARDFSRTASVGQRALEAVDAAMDSLRRGVVVLDVREKQDAVPFRCTFLGWKDYVGHQTRGRQLEYEQEMEE